MGELDPFGREVGEVSLSGLRGEAGDRGAAPAARATPVQSPGDSAAPPETPVPRPVAYRSRRRRSGVGRSLWGLVPFVIIAGIGVAIASSVGHTVSSVTDSIRGFKGFTVPSTPSVSIPAPPSIPGVTAPSGPTPTGLGRGSLLRPAGVRHTLALVRSARAGRLLLLRIQADRADVQAVGGGRATTIQVVPGGQRTVRRPGSAVPGAGALALSRVRPGTPARLITAAARRMDVPTARVDYVALVSFAGTPRWTVRFKGGAQWLGDTAGRLRQKVG